MNCSSKRLSQLVANDEVPFDADVAGPGVLIAFLATSLTALITLIMAFTTLSVPPRLLNTADALLCEIVRNIFRKIASRLSRTEGIEGQKERINGFMAFMVSISDQILVSEAAILIAGFISHKEVTIYSVNIIIALGCLACTVHLGSFPFFIESLKEHSTAKLIRVIMMSAGSGMLIFLLIIQLSTTWDSKTHVFFRCTLHDYHIEEYWLDVIVSLLVPISILYGTIEIIRLLYTSKPLGDAGQPPQTRQEERVSLSRERSFRNASRQRTLRDDDIELEQQRSQAIYFPEDQRMRMTHEQDSLNYHGVNDVEHMRGRVRRDGGQDEGDASYETESRQNLRASPRHRSRFLPTGLFEGTRPSKRNKLLNKWLQRRAASLIDSGRASKSRLHGKVLLVAESWAFHQCQGSFVWRLLWLWSGNVYGTVTVFTARANTTGMSGDRDKMGFGQIVPLALLVLPLFAAMQNYKERVKSLSINRRATQVRTGRIGRSAHRLVGEPYRNTTTRLFLNGPESLPMEHPERLQVFHKFHQLEERCSEIGRPCLFDWVRGRNLESSYYLQYAVVVHAVFMFAFTTLLGWAMASGENPTLNLMLFLILLLLALRKAVGLVAIFKDTKSESCLLDLLDSIREEEPPQAGNHGGRMMMANAAEGMQQGPEGDEEGE